MLKMCEDKGLPIPSVVILEARQVCSGATGRNGGQLKPDPYVRPADIATTHGFEAALECANFERSHVPAIKKTIEDENIDCDFVLTRCCDVLLTEDMASKLRTSVSMLRKAGLPTVVEDVYDGAAMDPQSAEQLSGVKGAKACFTYTAGHIYPYKFIHGLLMKCINKYGVNLQTNTPVTADIPKYPDPSDGRIEITTARGVIRAKKVVCATNAYTSSVLPEYAGRIVPVRGICSRITNASANTSPLQMSYIIRSSSTAYEYLIPRLDGSIIVGGARSKYMDKLSDWYDNVNDDALIPSAADFFDGYMQRYFKGWEKSGAITDRVWTGIMGYSSDNQPHVGPIPGRQNQFIIAGFTGHGMPQIFLSAKGLADSIVNGTPFSATGVPRLYQTTSERISSTRNTTLELWKESLPAHKSRL